LNSNIIDEYKREFPEDEYLDYPASNLSNQTIGTYYEIIKESFDENNNPINETDLLKIDNNVLLIFINQGLEFRNGNILDKRLEPILVKASSIRLKIQEIKNRKFETSVLNAINWCFDPLKDQT
jgi:hypothetical protein